MNIRENVSVRKKVKWKKVLLLAAVFAGTLLLVGMILFKTMYFHASADYFFKSPERRNATYFNGIYYTFASTRNEISWQGRHYTEAGLMHTDEGSLANPTGHIVRNHLVDKRGNIYETYYDGSRYKKIEPPVLVLPGSIKVGISWGTNDMFGTTCTIIGFQSVTVAAGTFEDCLVVETKFTLDGGSVGNVDVVGRDYYAKGIGLVQRTGLIGDTWITSMELVKVR